MTNSRVVQCPKRPGSNSIKSKGGSPFIIQSAKYLPTPPKRGENHSKSSLTNNIKINIGENISYKEYKELGKDF